jgi:hypothetical protein
MNEDRYKNLGIVRGGYYAKRDPRSFVVRQAALELQEWIVSRLGGRRKSRKLGCVQMGATTPLTEPIELAAELRTARVSFADSWRAVITPQAKALAKLHGKQFQTGDFDPPTPAQIKRAA